MLVSKVAKFRRGPSVFFSDSKSAWIRRIGRSAAPILEQPQFRRLLVEPIETLADLPGISPLAGSYTNFARRKRARLIGDAQEPKVSVIMAAWNAERTIGAAIDSMQAQTYSNFELLVVDDGSSDGTRELVAGLAAQDPRIQLVISPTNAGAAHARNMGLSRASGEFITFHDSDDRSHPERMERQLCALLRSSGKMFCLCSYSRVNDAGEVVSINGREVSKSVISMMFKRAVFARQGYFRALRVSEDAEYYSRMKTIFGKAAEVELFPVLYYQLFSPTSLLFSDGLTQSDGNTVIHKRSPEAEKALQEIEQLHRKIRAGADDGYVDFSPQELPFE